MTATLERPTTPARRTAAVAQPVTARPAPVPVRSKRAAAAIAVTSALALLGVLLLGLFAYLSLLAPVQQSRTQENLYKTLAEQLSLATAPVDGVIPTGVPVALVEIAALDVRQVVVEGTTSGALMNGPGHRRDTVLPGQAGVSVILGRSGLFGGPFASIWQLVPGDEIVVTTGQARSTFMVTGVRDSTQDIPPPTTAVGKLSLSTADPPLAPDQSIIVTADLTSALQTGSPETGVIGEEERSLAGDPAAVLPLMLWAQVLILVVAATTWGYLRWSRWPTYVMSTPVLIAVLWNVYENAAQLLPNTM